MTLYETSKFAKRSLKIGIGIVAAYYISVFVLFPLTKSAIRALIPEKDPPNPKYGALPQLKFKAIEINNDAKFTLNTKNGSLPNNLPKKMPVYQYRASGVSYGAGKKAIDDAARLGFGEEDLITDLKGDTYRWRDIGTNSFLEIKINTLDLILQTDIKNRGQFYITPGITKAAALSITKGILRDLGRLDAAGYNSGRATVTLGKFAGTSLIETTVSTDAQFALVDLFRSVNETPLVTPEFYKGLVRLMVRVPSKETSVYNHPNMELYYREINPTTDASYPLITVNEAWNEIIKNNGVVAGLKPKSQNPFAPTPAGRIDTILINNIYLGYYDSTDQQKYLQPVYVFEGNYTGPGSTGGGIVLYFPAITREYITAE